MLNKNLFLYLLMLIIHCDATFDNEDMQTTLNLENLDEIPPKEKEIVKSKLTIAFMLPQDIIRTRNNRQCIARELTKIRQSNWTFTKHFYLDR
jgi:hypothetical protein